MPQIQISKYDYLPGATPVRSGGEMKGGVGWGGVGLERPKVDENTTQLSREGGQEQHEKE